MQYTHMQRNVYYDVVSFIDDQSAALFLNFSQATQYKKKIELFARNLALQRRCYFST